MKFNGAILELFNSVARLPGSRHLGHIPNPSARILSKAISFVYQNAGLAHRAEALVPGVFGLFSLISQLPFLDLFLKDSSLSQRLPLPR